MEIFGILEPDPDPHENLCGSETLLLRINLPVISSIIYNMVRYVLKEENAAKNELKQS